MAWILTQSTTLPSSIISSATDNSTPPKGAIVVDMGVAVQAVGNPKGYILNSSVETSPGPDGKPVDKTVYSLTLAPLTLQAAQLQQRIAIKQSFLQAANANVTDSSGVIWEGGMASGNSIFLGCQSAQQAGAASITLYDAAKAPHSMTVAEGMGVAALIGAAYQTALGKKNTLYASIAAAKTVSAVQKIVW
jgi:hypothetical protein